MKDKLRHDVDMIIEVAHDSIPVPYIAHATSVAYDGVSGEGALIVMREFPQDVLANVRLFENGKFDVSSPASTGPMSEYVLRTQTALKAAHHLVCGGNAIAVEFKGDGTGLKVLEGQ